MLHHALDQDKRRAQIDIDRVVKLLERDVPDLRHAFPVPGVRDENVRPLAVLGVDVGEHARNVVGLADVDLVRGYAQRLVDESQFVDEHVDAGQARHVGEREMGAAGGQLAGTRGADSIVVSVYIYIYIYHNRV
jgi:hypothetical protein